MDAADGRTNAGGGDDVYDVDDDDDAASRRFPAFPFDPYPIQVDLMRGLYDVLQRGGLGIFESPTGTGKTLSVLCSALQWLEDDRRATHAARDDGASAGSPGAEKDEPAWLRDFERGKRERDFADRMKRRLERRAKARRRAADADRASFGPGAAGKPRATIPAAADAGDENGNGGAAAAEDAEFLAEDWNSDDGGGGEGGEGRKRIGDKPRDDPNWSAASEEEEDDDDDEDEDRPGAARRAGRFAGGVRVGEDSEADDDAAPNQVIFCSRTHSQLTQVVGELNRTRFGGAEGSVNAVAVAARTQLCVNPEVRATAGGSAARLNERCLELGKPKRPGEGRGSRVGGGCPFLKKRRRAVADLAEAALAVPMDIEDLAAAGTRRKACPYYAARHALPRADLVFAPYASLLHAETRESLLKGAVVVFDEAHNLVEAVHGAYGAMLTGRQVSAVHAMLTAYVERFYSRLSICNLRHLRTLTALCKAFLAALRQPPGARAASSEVRSLNDFIFSCGADNVNMFSLVRYLKESKVAHKIAGYAEHVVAASRDASGGEAAKWDWEDDAALGVVVPPVDPRVNHPTNPTTPRVGAVHALAAFVASLASADADGRILVEHEPHATASADTDGRAGPNPEGGGSNPGGDGGRLKFVLLDAAGRFKQVVDEARAVVLVGGTLSPIPELARQLFPDAKPVSASASASGEARPVGRSLTWLSCGHVVPRDSLLPMAVGAGPSGRAFDFSFAARGTPEMMDELGRLLVNACAVVPGGVVVFFPSFKYADDVYARWVKTNAVGQLSKHKFVFREPRTAAKVEKVLRDFAAAVDNGVDAGRTGSGGKVGGRTGAVMLCVCGGKLSEGINFKDDLGRLVVMVGLPFANPDEPELRARMQHLDAAEEADLNPSVGQNIHAAETSTSQKTRGRAYYEALCMRAVNQSVGRAIRHMGDYAAIIFADARYAPPGARSGSPVGISTQLPGWIRERLAVPRTYGEVQSGLVRFFQARRRTEAVAIESAPEADDETPRGNG